MFEKERNLYFSRDVHHFNFNVIIIILERVIEIKNLFLRILFWRNLNADWNFNSNFKWFAVFVFIRNLIKFVGKPKQGAKTNLFPSFIKYKLFCS